MNKSNLNSLWPPARSRLRNSVQVSLHRENSICTLSSADKKWEISNPASDTRRCVNPRRGFTIIEMVGTCFLLGIMLSMTVPMMMLVVRERRSTEQRQFALRHLENLIEQALSRPDSELLVGDLAIPDVDPDLAAVLPGLQRKLIVKPVEGEEGTRQLIGSIQWERTTGQVAPSIQLSAWIYPIKEAR